MRVVGRCFTIVPGAALGAAFFAVVDFFATVVDLFAFPLVVIDEAAAVVVVFCCKYILVGGPPFLFRGGGFVLAIVWCERL